MKKDVRTDVIRIRSVISKMILLKYIINKEKRARKCQKVEPTVTPRHQD
jgi:hypothetical protein